jgi:hypothetical protein
MWPAKLSISFQPAKLFPSKHISVCKKMLNWLNFPLMWASTEIVEQNNNESKDETIATFDGCNAGDNPLHSGPAHHFR